MNFSDPTQFLLDITAMIGGKKLLHCNAAFRLNMRIVFIPIIAF